MESTLAHNPEASQACSGSPGRALSVVLVTAIIGIGIVFSVGSVVGILAG